MSVSERRMFCLIWLLGGGGIGGTGGAEAAGWALEDEEWLEGGEETVDDGTLEDLDEWVLAGVSFCCGCFLGMVKFDLVTLNAPVTCIGPGGKGEGVWTGGGPGFLDFAVVLLGSVTGFLDDLDKLVVWREGFLLFGETLAALGVKDFLFPLTGVEEDFSGATTCSFSFCSLCFSLEGAENNKQQKNNKVIYSISRHKNISSYIRADKSQDN